MTYAQGKENARQAAIDWQADFANNNYSYGELAERSAYFERLARRYGLVGEFREKWYHLSPIQCDMMEE